MSDGTVYDVILRLSTQGSLSEGLGVVGVRANAAADKVDGIQRSSREAQNALFELGSSAGASLERIADKALDVGLSIGKWAGAGAIAAAAYGVGGLNNELEQTQIALAAIGQAQGFVGTFGAGMTMAADQVAKMKQEVKTLPGDLGQLSNIMKMIATPAAQGGASMDQIRKLSESTMLVGTILGVPNDVSSREMAQLLSGRAGAHNILGTRLGFVGAKAQELNAESPAERIREVTRELDKYQGAADRFSQSFVANWTTLKDNVKYGLISPATERLFGVVKEDLASINTYFDKHKEQVERTAEIVGDRLVEGYRDVEHILERIEPIAGKFFHELENASAGKLVSDLESVAEKLVAIKTGAAFIKEAFHWSQRFTGPAVPGSALAALGSSGGVASMVAAPEIVVAAFGAAAIATLVAAGYARNMLDPNARFHQMAVDLTKEDGKKFGPVLSKLFLHPLEMMTEGIDAAAAYAQLYGTRANQVITALAEGKLAELPRLWGVLSETIPQLTASDSKIPPFVSRQEQDAKRWADLMKKTQPQVNQTVNQTIRIDVSGNNDPERVARLIGLHLEKVSRYPAMSQLVPRYDGKRGPL